MGARTVSLVHKIKSWIKTPRYVVAITIILLLLPVTRLDFFPGGLGLNGGSSVVTKIVQQLPGDRTKETTITNNSGKTAWDWLSLIGVPLSLVLLGAWFQNTQQQRSRESAIEQRKQAEVSANQQREQAESERKEEVLQIYFDRISVLLVDKNLLRMANKQDQSALLGAAMDVIRARTLSTLRRFGDDGERKTSVIRFLVEAEVIKRLDLDLSKVELSFVNLNEVDISGANLRGAKLIGAELNCTNLRGANLHSAKLRRADLAGASLNSADLSSTDLSGATLRRTDLSGTDLSGADLSDADLSGADLSDADLSGADLSGATLSIATLHRTDLSGTNSSGAVLYGADLLNANLCNANLRNADLRRATLDQKQVVEILICNTQLPEGMEILTNRDCAKLDAPASF